MRGPRAVLLCAVVLVAAVAASDALPAQKKSASTAAFVTLRHAASGFSIEAPAGFSLSVHSGVYLMRNGNISVGFSRTVTTVSPTQYGAALLQQLGGRLVYRNGTASQFAAQVDRGARRESVLIRRDGHRLLVLTSSAPPSRALSLPVVLRIVGSARGGYTLRAPKSGAPKPLPMRQYQTSDGGATALVPAGNDWVIQGSQGRVEGSGPRGRFLFGFSYNVPLPESVPAGASNVLASPWLNAQTALTQLFPRFTPEVSNMRIRRLLKDVALPTFSSSAMYLYDFRVNGRPWVGIATVGTDSPAKYGNFVWNFYYSGIAVPANSSPAVGDALMRAWKSWNPSGAIAQRSVAAKQLLDETNAIWQQAGEFRSRIADQQSRDVGCLLQGYYIIEDNARKYELPPLPCGKIYTEK